MAAVFLAHDVRLDRKVALKVMSPMLATDARMVDRFRREAKTGASLKHPNIGTVYRVLESEGLYFFVMDFVRGRPLDTIIRRNGVLSVPAVRALLHQIGSGLAYAHRRKIYHRDVKPGNVLVSAVDGTAVVTDFGIAKVAESPNQTQTGAVVGTPAYMAPEQILGREVGAEVDQYALGIMAYEMLTGTPPFVGTNFVVMHAHTEIQPRAIRESRPECPPELDEAVMRMLAKEPNQRWPSLPHALAAMGAMFNGEEDPIREELIRLATPDDAEAARFATNTPVSPAPQHSARWAHVTSVVIYSPPPVIEVGDSFRLTASPRDGQGDVVPDAPLDWSSTDNSVLSVHHDGLITAVSVGSAEVFATSGRARGMVVLNVVPSRVVNLQLSIPPGVLVAGDRIQLAARAVDKHQRPLAYSVRWGVADQSVAEVSPEGVLQARAPGMVEVYAEAHGVRTGARVEIASPAVEAVSLVFEPARPVVGDRILVNPTLLDSGGQPLRDRAMAWSINDRSLVRVVTDGVYEATAEGTLTVSVTSEGKNAVVAIAIAPAPVAAVRISQAPQAVVVGNTFKLVGTAHDARGNVLPGRQIEWSVGDVSFASVTDTGTVSAIAPGDLRVVATLRRQVSRASDQHPTAGDRRGADLWSPAGRVREDAVPFGRGHHRQLGQAGSQNCGVALVERLDREHCSDGSSHGVVARPRAHQRRRGGCRRVGGGRRRRTASSKNRRRTGAASGCARHSEYGDERACIGGNAIGRSVARGRHRADGADGSSGGRADERAAQRTGTSVRARWIRRRVFGDAAHSPPVGADARTRAKGRLSTTPGIANGSAKESIRRRRCISGRGGCDRARSDDALELRRDEHHALRFGGVGASGSDG